MKKNRVFLTLGIVAIMGAAVAVAQTTDILTMRSAHIQVEAGLSAEQYHAKAVDLGQVADATYAVDYFDQFGWQEAVVYAEAAVMAEPSNTTYVRTLADFYTKTQFWIAGYQTWKKLEALTSLDQSAKEMAALSAAKVGYIRMNNGLADEAVAFFQESLRWQENGEVRKMLAQAERQIEVAGQ